MPQACRARPKGHRGRTQRRIGARQDYVNALTPDALLFAPGTGVLYSNFGFRSAGAGFGQCRRQALPGLLEERVLDPAGLKDTRFDLTEADKVPDHARTQFRRLADAVHPHLATDRRRRRSLLDGQRHVALARLASRPLRHGERGDAAPRPRSLFGSRRPQSGVRHGRGRHDGRHGARLGGHATRGQSTADPAQIRAACRASSASSPSRRRAASACSCR